MADNRNKNDFLLSYLSNRELSVCVKIKIPIARFAKISTGKILNLHWK